MKITFTRDEIDAAVAALVAVCKLPMESRMNAWALATKGLVEGHLDDAIANAGGDMRTDHERMGFSGALIDYDKPSPCGVFWWAENGCSIKRPNRQQNGGHVCCVITGGGSPDHAQHECPCGQRMTA